MFALLRPAVVALLLLLGPAAPAFGWGHRRAAVASYYYSGYYSAPVGYYFGPAVPMIYSQPIAVAPVATVPAVPPVYAVPTPAPAISAPTPAPPPVTMPPAAGVTESRSSYLRTPSYYAGPASADGTVPVTFWNRSSRDLWVQISGEWRLVRQNRGVTLDLPRGFLWQVQGQTAQHERVPPERSEMQIVIR